MGKEKKHKNISDAKTGKTNESKPTLGNIKSIKPVRILECLTPERLAILNEKRSKSTD